MAKINIKEIDLTTYKVTVVDVHVTTHEVTVNLSYALSLTASKISTEQLIKNAFALTMVSLLSNNTCRPRLTAKA